MDELIAQLEKEHQTELQKLEAERKATVSQLNDKVSKLHVKHSTARAELAQRKNTELKSINDSEKAQIKEVQRVIKQRRTQATKKYEDEAAALSESIRQEMQPCNEDALNGEAKFKDQVAELDRKYKQKVEEAKSKSGPLGDTATRQ